MTCKQCIHEKVCPHLKDEDAERCKQFADKDEYVRVHRYKRHTKQGATKTIGQIIYEKRKVMGLTIKKLAEKIDASPTTLSSWELDKAYPNALFLASLADVFECSIDEICGR